MHIPAFPPRLHEWLPGLPFEEPPLPYFMLHSPALAEVPLLYDSETEEWTEAKKKELLEKGYSEPVINAALTWASSYAKGVVGFFKPAGVEAETLYKGAYKIALDHVEDWYEGLKGAFI